MKQLPILFFFVLSFGLSAQTEHWKFNYLIGLDQPAEAEIYAERGRFYMKVTAEGMSSQTFVDSTQHMVLQLNDRGYTKEYTLYYLAGAEFPESVVRVAPDGTEYTVVPSVLPEREPQVEGVNFELLREKKKKFGLVLYKAKLTFPELDMEAEGWIVKGKMAGSLGQYVFRNGEVGGLVESEISYSGFTMKTELVSFEEVKQMPEGLFSMEIPEGYEDSDRETAYEYGDEETYSGEEYYDMEYFEPYKPSGKPEPETVAAEQWRLSRESDYDVNDQVDIFVAPGRYRVERGAMYKNNVATIVDSSVYWRLELEDYGFSYFRLEPFYASKANTDSLEKPSYITEKEPRETAAEGEAFRLLGDTKNWNGMKLYHVALLTWKDDWAQGDGWLLLRELPGLEDEPLFVLKDGRKGTLIEYDFHLLGPSDEARPDSLRPALPDTAYMEFAVPEVVEDVEAPVVEEVMPVEGNADHEDIVEDNWGIGIPEPEPEIVAYDAWSEMRWDSSQEMFDMPMPDIAIDATDTPYGVEEYYDYDDSWRYPQHYKRKLLLYGKTVVSGSLFSLTPPDDFYDMQSHD